MDTVDTSLRLNVQQGLSDLSEGTGGFLVANANDFGKAVDRVAADIRGYYEIEYSPAVVAFDGELPAYQPQGVPQGRGPPVAEGLLALPPSDQIVLPHEMPLFMALSAPTSPHDFVHQAAALHFAPGPGAPRPPSWWRCRSPPVDFTVNKKKKTFEQRLTTLAVVKDADGRVVERFSDEYPLSGPLDQLEAAKQSNAVLRRTVPLGAGRYTLETVSQVKGTGKTSVERSSFEVPAAGSGPQLSSLCLLRRADPLPASAPPSDDPFRVRRHAPRPAPRGAGEPGGNPQPFLLRACLPQRLRSRCRSSRWTSCATGRSSAAPSRRCPHPTRAGTSRTSEACRVGLPPGASEIRADAGAGHGQGDRRDTLRLGALTRPASRSKSDIAKGQHGLSGRRSSEPTSPNGSCGPGARDASSGSRRDKEWLDAPIRPVATLVLSVAIAGAQTPPPPSPQKTPEFRAGTAVVRPRRDRAGQEGPPGP